MKSVIRPAIRGDVPALTSIIRTAFCDVAARFGLTAENCPRHPSNCEPIWVEDALARGVCYFVAEVKGTPVGCVALAHPRPAVCYLERLAVVPAHRSTGLGTALTQRAFTEAKAWGADRVEIGVIAGHTDLIEWYEKRGFEKLHTTRFPHLPFDVLFMAASLQGNAPGRSPRPISSSQRVVSIGAQGDRSPWTSDSCRASLSQGLRRVTIGPRSHPPPKRANGQT